MQSACHSVSDELENGIVAVESTVAPPCDVTTFFVM